MNQPCTACGTITSNPLGFCSSDCHAEYEAWLKEHDNKRIAAFNDLGNFFADNPDLLSLFE
jgi:hypothetical protein